MKLLGVLSALFVFTLAFMAQGESASAQTPTYNNKLQITGIVLPAQHVIVDEQGNIIEILSNTDKDVTPKVYINKISKENIRELTPDIYEQYRRLVPSGSSKVGTLYKRMPGTYTATPLETLHGNRPVHYDLPLPE